MSTLMIIEMKLNHIELVGNSGGNIVDNINLVSATTAYQRTEEVIDINQALHEELEYISKHINNAIQEGKFEVVLNTCYISERATRELANLGYGIQIVASYLDPGHKAFLTTSSGVKIKWDFKTVGMRD